MKFSVMLSMAIIDRATDEQFNKYVLKVQCLDTLILYSF